MALSFSQKSNSSARLRRNTASDKDRARLRQSTSGATSRRSGTAGLGTSQKKKRLNTPGGSGGGKGFLGNRDKNRKSASTGIPMPALIAAGVAALAVVGLVALLVLSQLPVFVITAIDADSTEHINAETIARLAEVEEGTTLLNLNTGEITANVQRNPWVGSVKIIREFPDRLRIVVTEREVGAIVLMGSGDAAWCLGSDGVWIEPVQLNTSDKRSAEEVALERASELGCLLITDVPSSVSPQAGAEVTDDTILAVLEYLNGFSEDFRSQISSFSATSVDAIACTLTNGVEVSLGNATDINAKERIITQILAEHPNQVTYINVRVPSSPSYRSISADNVVAGSGARVLNEDEETTDNNDETTANQDSSNTSSNSETNSEDESDDTSQEDESSNESSTNESSGGSSAEIDPSLSAG